MEYSESFNHSLSVVTHLIEALDLNKSQKFLLILSLALEWCELREPEESERKLQEYVRSEKISNIDEMRQQMSDYNFLIKEFRSNVETILKCAGVCKSNKIKKENKVC